MIERLLFALALMAAGLMVYRFFIAQQKRKTTELVAAVDPLLSDVQRGTPLILYFTTPTCVPCRVVQQPALQRLQSEMGESLQVIRVDATEQPEDADRWGVLSAPTTFVIDPNGKTRAVNHGVAEYHLLKRQLSDALAS